MYWIPMYKKRLRNVLLFKHLICIENLVFLIQLCTLYLWFISIILMYVKFSL